MLINTGPLPWGELRDEPGRTPILHRWGA
jgi:hypothetical protein